MYSLCMEYSGFSVEKDGRARYRSLAENFLAHFEEELGELRMTLPVTHENVEALTIAVRTGEDTPRQENRTDKYARHPAQ